MYHKISKKVKLFILVTLMLLITSCLADEKSSLLLFSHRTTEEMEFYLVEADGTGRELITTIPLNHSFYGFSPDGTKLATGLRPKTLNIMEVSSGKILATISEAGVNEWHELMEKGKIVAWSPDGNQIVFLRETLATEGIELVLYNITDGIQTILASDGSLYRSPVWSPDGRQIAVAKIASCGLPFRQCPPEENNWNIVVFNVDNHTSQQITNFDNIAGKFQSLLSKSLCGLDWSPAGDFILFENSCSQFEPNAGREVFVVSTKTKQVVQLTDFNYDDNRYIVHYAPKWLGMDNHLLVGYSIIPMMPPSSGLTAQHGYNVYQNNAFNKMHSINLEEYPNIFPIWSTIDDQFALMTKNDNETNCRQLFLGEQSESDYTVTPQTDWPLLTTYSNVLRSSTGNHLAYLTTGENCDGENNPQPSIVTINLNTNQVSTHDMTGLSGEIELLEWVQLPKN